MTPPTETSPARGGAPAAGPAADPGERPHRSEPARTVPEGRTVRNGLRSGDGKADEIDVRDGRPTAAPTGNTIDLRDGHAPAADRTATDRTAGTFPATVRSPRNDGPDRPGGPAPREGGTREPADRAGGAQGRGHRIPTPHGPDPRGTRSVPDTSDSPDAQDTTPVPRRTRAELRAAVEAVLMVVDEPVEPLSLASALNITVERVDTVLTELVADYDDTGRGFELRRVAGGWRIYSRREHADVVERFLIDGQTARLTQAALETLAIVAYRQPVSRSRVGAVRGVNVDAVMRTLTTRGLVEEAGHDPETGAVLYATTQYFLQRIGLESIEQLPALAPYLPAADALEEIAAGGSA